jgi:hypothetical protein
VVSTQNISIAFEFPSVFLKELSCMPPDHDIEFVIELVPITAHIFKGSYRMVTNQLVELKE